MSTETPSEIEDYLEMKEKLEKLRGVIDIGRKENGKNFKDDEINFEQFAEQSFIDKFRKEDGSIDWGLLRAECDLDENQRGNS